MPHRHRGGMRVTTVARTGLTILTLTIATTSLVAEEKKGGQLQRAREEVRPKSADPSPTSPTPTTHDHDQQATHSHGSDVTWSVVDLFFGREYNTAQPAAAEDQGPSGLLAYPYADDQPGWQIDGLAPPRDPNGPARARVHGFGGTLRGEYTDGGDGLHRYAGALSLAFGGVRLEGDLQRYIEHLPDDVTDTLSLGTIGLGFVLPMAGNHLTLMAGGGLSFYHDHYGNESGWYAKAGAEVFPIRPLVLSAEVWGGFIADDDYDETETFMGSGRATLGVVWNRFEIFGGWQATWIESVTLHGPTGGVRFWF